MAYSIERKEAILKKLLPPANQTVAEVARAEGLSVNTLYQWRDKARQSGHPVPGKTPTANDWSAVTPVKEDIFNYIEMFYNPVKQHGYNDCLSPMEFENIYFKKIASV